MKLSEDVQRSQNIRLIVEYDGSGFQGFQKQSVGRTVQRELERALGALLQEPIGIIGAGRTDAGVHAEGQVVNFLWPGKMQLERIVGALNRMLPKDIVVREADSVAESFHARYSATARVYEYTVLNRVRPSALESRFVWHVSTKLDLSVMREASLLLLGTHDFRVFGTAECGRSAVRTIDRLDIRREGGRVMIKCQANAFLRHMVRGIVGALVDVGTGRRSTVDVKASLGELPCARSFSIAPPNGLSLICVRY